ncbi:hypothetical protein [Neisseria weaveri]|uniref:hypothetical protein n=1 Tax=Neisseria weaveri TaxID=28091 RepID=UPI000D300B6F|nr:hypothetical protein [Neisseria weaveri]
MTQHVATILTALFSGGFVILGVVLTNRHNLKQLRLQHENERVKESRDLLRQRGEELYELVAQWIDGITSVYLHRNILMQGKITLDECVELDKKYLSKTKNDYDRLVMLIEVYFPEVRSVYDEVINARSEINAISIAFEKRYRSGQTDGSTFIQSYVKAQIEFEQVSDHLKYEIIKAIREI